MISREEMEIISMISMISFHEKIFNVDKDKHRLEIKKEYVPVDLDCQEKIYSMDYFR